MLFRFGSYELDEAAGELRRDGTSVRIQPKPLALLQHLVRERERVVPIEELYELLWAGVAVTPSSLTRAVSVARSAIGDTGRGDVIRSVARRGYRFCADVIVIDSRLSGAAPAARSPAGAAGRDPFVGREAALATLRAAWTEAASGSGRIALVTGPPGIGKTRLCEELGLEVGQAGARLLTARARDGEGVPALWLWAQVLRQLAALPKGPHGDALGTAASALVELAPELATGLPQSERRSAARSLEQNRFLLFDAIAGALVRLARERPVVLSLEDLQWAGDTSLRLLEHLVFEMAGAPLLVLATVRSDVRPPDHPVERMLASLRAQRSCAEVALRGLSRREVAQLVEHALGRPPPPDLSSELVARTEGVPLLVREALRLLGERGDLLQPDAVRRWAVSLPTHALDLVQRPLERLSARSAELLAAGAVLGREWALPLAAAVAGIERDAALDLADEAAAVGVLEPAPDAPAAWRFSHALFQEVLRGRLPAGRRARLHARAAAELERRHGADHAAVIAELSHHHHESLAVGDPARAFECAKLAASQALRVFAFEQAAAHYRKALAALEYLPVDAARRLATLLELGTVLRHAGDRTRRREVFDRAMGEARALGRPLELARAAVGFCDLAEWAPEDEEAFARLEEARALLAGDAELERAQVSTRIAYLSARRRPDRALPTAREAVELARRLADPEVRQDALYGLHFLLAGPDHLDEREQLAAEITEVARAGPASDVSIIAILDDASDRLALGDGAAARQTRSLAGEVTSGSPSPARRFNLTVYDAGVALLEGRVADSARLVDEAEALGLRIQHPYARGVQRMLRSVAARLRGDEMEVLRLLDPRPQFRYGPVQWVTAFGGRALLAVGRTAEGRALFEELVTTGFDAIPRNIRWPNTIVEIANLCADLCDTARAEALIALLEPCANLHGVLPLAIAYGGPFTRALARLATVCGRTDRADDLYAQAADSCARLGAQPMHAQVLLEHGALELRRRERRRARERLEESSALAASLGLEVLAAQARHLVERSARS